MSDQDMLIRGLQHQNDEEQESLLALTQRALARANDYIDMLNRGVNPVHSSYWRTVHAYTQAMDELREAMEGLA